MKPTLSVILIVRNEAEMIAETLQAVAWADEIVVLDSGSTDDTVGICHLYTDKIWETDWPGFGAQKNRALERATGDWVLSLDADERVSPELRAEIEAAIADPKGCDAFELPRLSRYCGRAIHHSGWWPDPVCRLFKRGRAHFSDDRVHERLIVDGRVGRLTQSLQHESFRDLAEVLAKVNHYSDESARMLQQRGKRGSVGKAVGHGLWAFLRTYILRRGFLDGREGFLLAVSNAEGTYYRYIKLMYLNEQAQRPEC